MTTTTLPQFSGQPVILIHLEDPAGSGLAACAGVPFETPANYDHSVIPRVLCPACARGWTTTVHKP